MSTPLCFTWLLVTVLCFSSIFAPTTAVTFRTHGCSQVNRVPPSRPVPEHDIPEEIEDKIIGGITAQPNSWPWMVSLRYKDDPMCGATVLNNRFLLTAAHCFRDRPSATLWTANLANHNFEDVNEPGEKIVQVHRLIIHPKNGLNPQFRDDYDIAIVKLAQPVQFTDKIKPIRLSNMPPIEGETCTVTGWGVTKYTAPYNLLNEVQVPIISARRCNTTEFLDLTGRITDNMFCAGYKDGGKDSCVGDSGGPIMCKRGQTWYQFGVVSWGSGCGEPNAPGVYARTDGKVKAWIEYTIRG